MPRRTGPRRRARRRWGGRHDERGSVSAELVIATPLFLLLVLGVVQFALWEHATHVAQAVAAEGLAAGRLADASDQAAVSEADAVLAQLGSAVLVGAQVSATRTAEGTTVIVTGRAEELLPFFTLPVRAVAVGPTESFTTSGAGP